MVKCPRSKQAGGGSRQRQVRRGKVEGVRLWQGRSLGSVDGSMSTWGYLQRCHMGQSGQVTDAEK